MLVLRRPGSEAWADVPGLEDDGVRVRYRVPDEDTARFMFEQIKRAGTSRKASEFDIARTVFAKLYIEVEGVQVDGEDEAGLKIEVENGKLTRDCADTLVPLFFPLFELASNLCGLSIGERKNS